MLTGKDNNVTYFTFNLKPTKLSVYYIQISLAPSLVQRINQTRHGTGSYLWNCNMKGLLPIKKSVIWYLDILIYTHHPSFLYLIFIYSGNFIEVALWEHHAIAFNQAACQGDTDPVVVAITSLKVSIYGRELQLASTAATESYINPCIPQLGTLIKRYMNYQLY